MPPIRMSYGRIGSFLALALLAPILSGCGLFGPSDKPTCPRISIPADADRMTRFRPGPGRDLTDVRFQNKIGSYSGNCSYDRDTKTMKVVIQLTFTANLGPAATGRNATIDYFVAIPGFFPSPQAKQILRLPVTFPPGVDQADFKDDQVEINLPNINLGNLDKDEIFLGLQLAPADLEYNRTHRPTR